jgi:hypothetical protein
MVRPTISVAAVALILVAGTGSPGFAVEPARLSGAEPSIGSDAPVMGDYPESVYAEAADDLPDDLIRELADSVGQSGEEYLAQADAAADASRVVVYLKGESSVLGARLEGTTLVVNVESPADAELARALGARAEIGEPENPEFDLGETAFTDEIWSGEAIGYPGTGGQTYRCSLGFNGYSSNSGEPEFVTAGHCFDGGSDPYYYLPQTAPNVFQGAADRIGTALPTTVHFGNGNDTGLVALDDPDWDGPGYVQTWNGGAGAPTSGMSVMGSIPAIIGASLCKSGSTTGWTCGFIHATDFLVEVGPDEVAVNSIVTDACMQPGDSGGAGLVGQLAVGVSSWSTTASCGSDDYFSGFFPVESPDGREDVYTANPDWELAAFVYPAAVTEPGEGDTYDIDESIGGTLPIFGSAARYAVDLYFDGSSTPETVSVDENGLWTYPVASLPAGNHRVVVGGRWGLWSHATLSPGYDFTVAAGSGTVNQNFVRQMYRDFLGREASEGEVTYWADRLASGQADRYGLATTLSRSDEWISTVITEFYRDTLGREPDAAGLRGWIDAARAGMPIAQIASAFYASPEYFQTVGNSDDRTWVEDLYRKLLLREGESSGVAGWVRALQAGMARDSLSFGFYQSPETLGVRITTLYADLLGRSPEPGAIPNWSPFVASNGDLVLAAALAASEEYLNYSQTPH